MTPAEHRDEARRLMEAEYHGVEAKTQRAVEVLAHLAMADMEERSTPATTSRPIGFIQPTEPDPAPSS